MITRIALILAAAILIGGCGTPTKPDPVEGQSRETAEPTMAEVWAQSAQASLDMNMETFFSQMPDDLVDAQWSSSPTGQRMHTMTWSDGSVVITHWEPGAVPGEGLRLDFIKKIGK